MGRFPPVPEDEPSDLEFTVHARRAIVRTVKDPYFRDRDPELMFAALMEEIRSISFGDYLKRYIRKKSAESCSPDGSAETDYICEAFKRTGVPPSFSPTTAKIRALARNWLSQRVVNRNVVLLLGFALEMAPEDVNDFLTRALKESRIDPKDPFEVICWYCYRFRLPYSKYEELWNRVAAGRLIRSEAPVIQESTLHLRKSMEGIRSERELSDYLSGLKLTSHTGRQSVSARKQFDELYGRACAIAADIRTEAEQEDAETRAGRFADNIRRSDRLYDYQKAEQIRKAREQYHEYRAEEITPADLENILYSAIPKDRNGNLIPMKESLLNIHFSGKRLSRQHISEILDGKGTINRFDIITLCFFVTAKESEDAGSRRSRYDLFVRTANRYLSGSDMEPLYAANPYESFVLMCMLTEDPLGSFSDVWELSYEAE